MKWFCILSLACIFHLALYAQQNCQAILNIGDPAPSLRTNSWIKGGSIATFQPGVIYVIEYWSTWCKPCKAAMPHLSELAKKYKDVVTIIGLNIYEQPGVSLQALKDFVASMGDRMSYHVASQDSNMLRDWIIAAGEEETGIPNTFVINKEGRIAWIGHPKDVDSVLEKLVKNTWSIADARKKRMLNKRLRYLDREAYIQLAPFRGNVVDPDDPGKPDSMLVAIQQMIEAEPKLKYTPVIAFHTFTSLLLTDLDKALAYGKEAIQTATYDVPACAFIGHAIEKYAAKLKLPAAFYLLGAEACRGEIDNYAFPEKPLLARKYKKMANWYRLANDIRQAERAEQKAMALLQQ